MGISSTRLTKDKYLVVTIQHPRLGMKNVNVETPSETYTRNIKFYWEPVTFQVEH